ncbi:VirB3 family type IV secretion system protein [Succinivibrio sp.]|uniref:VirB3 family type IV secretion system protein n=1 Tax=Succinivibrio sp. TaxID=2053619 RepID=UPI003866A898
MSDQESKYVLQNSPIFKGATRPPCVLGIPITPLVFVAGGILIGSLVIWIPLVFSLVPILWMMHKIAKDDDQRFLQLWLSYKLNILGSNRHLFTGYNAIFPVIYKRDNKCNKKH